MSPSEEGAGIGCHFVAEEADPAIPPGLAVLGFLQDPGPRGRAVMSAGIQRLGQPTAFPSARYG